MPEDFDVYIESLGPLTDEEVYGDNDDHPEDWYEEYLA